MLGPNNPWYWLSWGCHQILWWFSLTWFSYQNIIVLPLQDLPLVVIPCVFPPRIFEVSSILLLLMLSVCFLCLWQIKLSRIPIIIQNSCPLTLPMQSLSSNTPSLKIIVIRIGSLNIPFPMVLGRVTCCLFWLHLCQSSSTVCMTGQVRLVHIYLLVRHL